MLRNVCAAARLLAFVGFALVAAHPAMAQVDRGNIVGTVTDPSGARISGAQITITHRGTGQTIHFTTDDEGNYNANLLKIGTYSVSATRQGFQTTGAVRRGCSGQPERAGRHDADARVRIRKSRGDGRCPAAANGILFPGHS